MSELQSLSIGTKEGWAKIANAAPTPRPRLLSATQLKKMSSAELTAYNKSRRVWHANMGVLRTPQLKALHEHLWDAVDANEHNGDKAKPPVAVEGDSNVGKSTAVQLFAKEFHRREIAENGDRTAAGNERWPVARVTLTGNPTIRDLNASLLHYFAHPGIQRGNAGDLGRRALGLFIACDVRLLIVDDLHFLRWESADGSKVSNQLKYLATEFPITLLLVGVGLTELGLYRRDRTFGKAVLGPAARRIIRGRIDPFDARTAQGRREFRTVVRAVEHNLVLSNHQAGTLSQTLNDYLHDRTTGYMGSLVNFIIRGCARAIRTGAEALTEELLDQVQIDVAAETARKQTAKLLRDCGTAGYEV